MSLETPWAAPTDEVLAALDTEERGLSAEAAAARLRETGPNRLPEPPRPGLIGRLLRQVNNLLILALIVAAAITALLGHWLDTGVILAVVIFNTVFGLIQEGRAEQAIAALRGMLAEEAAVRRDGRRQVVPAADLVPGDIVLIEAGDKVPADLRLVGLAALRVDEAILTGESVPAPKDVTPVAADAALGDRRAMVFSGTLVSEGTGTGVVVATGAATEIGRISGLMSGVERLTTPLVRQMDQLARVLTFAVMAVAAAVLAFTTLGRGMDFADAFMIVVGLFVAAIPEGLPAILTVTLAIGVQAMARRHAIVRRLPAIETIGAVTTICSDKTGTLTRNEMMVTVLETAAGRYGLEGEGYDPAGRVIKDGQVTAPDNLLRAIAGVAAGCNSAEIKPGPGGWRTEGDPMEGALLALAGRLGLDPAARPVAGATIPFDARYRYMAVASDGMVLVKGAPEQVLARCGAVETGEGEAPFDPACWADRADEIAAEGLRVLALARKPHAGAGLGHEDIAGGLVLLGLAGFIDPPRPEAIRAVADCRAAGIAVRMITGDHKGTAAAIARQISLDAPGHVLTGADLDLMDDAALRSAVTGVSVFARTSPEHKLRLVEALQANGAVVAMTGDGVNDAPALKRADIGIAMGHKGSQAAREAADVVLTDDNFASIAEAVRQGRTVYGNLRKVITFVLPVNGGESISLILAVLLGLTLPITPLQILWVNMVSSVGLAMALAFERPEPQVMQQPPRRTDTPILSGFVLWRIVLVSALFAAGIFGQFELALRSGADEAVARTMAVNTLVAMEVFYLFSVRYRLGASMTVAGVRGTPAVLVAIAVVTLFQLGFTYLPLAQTLFETRPLGLWQLVQCVAAGVALLLVLEIDKAVRGALGAMRGREKGAV
ncbi:cation-translocating P-type ATPase [Halodurantibacterium flavum]|uniref:Cation-translocating P-type ATPase n=2 Tax=Halodurantibacterium flavum TaxID=1382802 RepID=A0ABW4S5V7_9RHOB